MTTTKLIKLTQIAINKGYEVLPYTAFEGNDDIRKAREVLLKKGEKYIPIFGWQYIGPKALEKEITRHED